MIVSALNAPIVADRLRDDSPARYNERLKNFKALMRWAYRNDLVNDISYLDKLQRAKDLPVREKDKEKYLEHGEIKSVLSVMTVEQWRLLTEFLILTGMRIGEAIALTVADVDVHRREISISKTYSITIRDISTTKTEMSCRVIDMQDELMDCYHQIRRLELEHQLQYGFRSNLVFSDANTGSYIHYDAYRKYLRETTLKAIGRPLTPHALRHTHVAMLAEAGMPLETIMRRVGHANSQVTKDVYMHVTDRVRNCDRSLIQNITILRSLNFCYLFATRGIILNIKKPRK